MRTDEALSFYERYLSIRERVERRTLEQGMVQTFAPPGSTPAYHPGPRRRRRAGVAGRARDTVRRRGQAVVASGAVLTRARCQLALDLP